MADEYSGRILIRISPELHKQATESAHAEKVSLNQFIANQIREGVEKTMTSTLSYEQVDISELVKCREMAILAQYPWFMQFVNQYNICFLRDTENITPMQYVLFYETESSDEYGSSEHPRSIAKWAKVKKIYKNISPSFYQGVEELNPLTENNTLWPTVSEWPTSNVVILEKVMRLSTPLKLVNGRLARNLNNRTISFPKLLNASIIDDLL